MLKKLDINLLKGTLGTWKINVDGPRLCPCCREWQEKQLKEIDFKLNSKRDD